MLPAGGQALDVVAIHGDELIDADAVRLWVDSGMGYTSSTAQSLGTNTYRGTFPAAACGSQVRYFFEFPLESGERLFSPQRGSAAPFEVRIASASMIVELDNLETSAGWTIGSPNDDATTGVWDWGVPVGSASAPTEDHSEFGTHCFVTGFSRAGGPSSDNDVDGGRTTLTSPPLDLSGLQDPNLAYWRWYTNADGSLVNDTFVVDVSGDDGQTWVRVDAVGPQPVVAKWTQHSFPVHAYVPGATSVRLRFIASDLDGEGIVEAAIDDIHLVEGCTTPCRAARFCTAAPNSTGQASRISHTGSLSIWRDDLQLHASHAPRHAFGLFLYSADQASIPAGVGTLCLGTTTLGTLIRLSAVQTDALGAASHALDLRVPPIAAAQILPATTWHFQFSYRYAPGGTPVLNFSDALSLTFCP